MKLILKVARTELRTLFYSPIAWFLMIAFLVQCGIAYFTQMDFAGRIMGLFANKEFYGSITSWVFLGISGMFANVMDKLYLYIPLLTMSLISREMSSGTVRLLYSSPVSMWEIVLGKYIAMMAYSVVMVLTVAIFMFSGVISIQHAETGMLLSALLGFYLLLCAYSAIGLFMSCLTSYQVVAAISTFVMIGILSYIGGIWQDIDFVREITFYLSIRGRAQHMLLGLISTKDVLYFLVIVYIFLGLSILKLRAGMESGSGVAKAMRYVGVVASALFIGYLSSIPAFSGYWDTTSDRANTLTPRVQQIVKNLGAEPLRVTAYANLLEKHFTLGSPASYNQNKVRWEPYLRFKDNIILDKVMYYDTLFTDELVRRYPGKKLNDIAQQYARSYDVDLKDMLTPWQIRKQIDLRVEGNRYVMKLQWKNRTTFLRVFDDIYTWPSETEVAAALLRLQQATLPKLAFVSSEMERDINKSGERDYKELTNEPSFRYSLLNQGFDMISLSLESDSIPAGISALVLADPIIGLSPAATEKLQHYIQRGGNLLIAGEPGKQAMMNPLLKQLGVQLTEGMVLQDSRDNAPDFVSAVVDNEALSFYSELRYIMKDSLRLIMPGTAGITYTNDGPFSIRPLATTVGNKTWNRVKPVDMMTMVHAKVSKEEPVTAGLPGDAGNDPRQRGASRRDSLGTVYFSAAGGDVMGPVTTVVGLSRRLGGREQRIVVAGDADFMSNKVLDSRQRTANFIFGTALFRWLGGGELPVDTRRPDPQDKKMSATLENIRLQKTICLWVLPALLLIFGSVLLIRRKRK